MDLIKSQFIAWKLVVNQFQEHRRISLNMVNFVRTQRITKNNKNEFRKQNVDSSIKNIFLYILLLSFSLFLRCFHQFLGEKYLLQVAPPHLNMLHYDYGFNPRLTKVFLEH